MQKREIFKKIGGIITELNDQYQYLSQNPESLNDLELELFLANANFLGDHIEILRKLNSLQAATAPEVQAPSIQIIPAAEDKPLPKPDLTSLLALPAEETSFEYEQKSVDQLFDRTLSPEEQAILDRKKESVAEVTQEQQPDLSDASPVPAEPVTIPVQPVLETAEPARVEAVKEKNGEATQITLNDLISSQVQTGTVASRFHQNSVSDLKSIISLNDKLLFIKDLFNGYSLAYSEAIELVNRYDSFDAADNFLKHNYAIKNKWESKPETVEKFYEILSRRFA